MKYLSLLKDITGDNNIYIVGGAIRDYLLNKEMKDIDLVVMSGFDKTVDKFVDITDKKKIVLDKKRKIYRIVTDDKKFIDFTTPVGQDLYQDLGCRDFTINSMALNLKNIEFKNEKIIIKNKDIIDPFGGQSDLENKIIRMVRVDFITEDPLRILRAFRFSNNLDFFIEDETYKIIKENIKLILNIANERIKEELYQLYSAYLNPKRFKLFIESNLLKELFDLDLKRESELRKKTLKQLQYVKQKNYLEEIKIKNYLFNFILFFILPVYKDEVSIKELKEKLIKYTFNKRDINLITEYLNILKKLLKDYKSLINNDILLYEELFSEGLDIELLKYLLLSFFQVQKYSQKKELAFKILNRLTKMQKRTARRLIDGNDIKNILNIEKGKLVGEILDEIKEKQALGVFKKRSQILKYIEENY